MEVLSGLTVKVWNVKNNYIVRLYKVVIVTNNVIGNNITCPKKLFDMKLVDNVKCNTVTNQITFHTVSYSVQKKINFGGLFTPGEII